MEITVKVRPGRKAKAVVREQLKEAHPHAKIEEVFPGVDAGRRAGMLVVTVPDEDGEGALRALRGHDDVEYAEPAAARSAKSRQARELRTERERRTRKLR
jgi:beta-phosphoglucomutase-like phosphatase (HAD superfamily)